MLLLSAGSSVSTRDLTAQVITKLGEPGVLVHGPLHGALITQVVTNWMGPTGFLKRVGWNNRGMAVVGETLVCKGVVTRRYVEDGEHLVDCEIWNENERGERLTVGTATVRLQVRTGL